MLTIKTDIKNKNWLIYILNQFKEINLVEFNIEILSLEEYTSNKSIIYYMSSKINDISIYNSNEQVPSSKIEYIKDDLFIIENTKSDDFSIDYDIFWNAFVFLSRYEEYLSEESEKNIYSYSSNHPRVDKSSFDIPIVNVLFNELELFIKDNFYELTFGDKKKPIIDLSHDVDYVNKTIQLRLKQTAFNAYNTLKSINKPRQFSKNLVKTFKFAFSNPSYWCFDYWVDLEKKNNKKSIFYIYVKNGKKDFKSWLIDPSYDVATDIRLQNKLKELHKDGFEIGLHGSYESAKDFELLKKEKEILEDALGFTIEKTRQHWLHYFENFTPYSHEKLFKKDSTLGWNDIIGFRSGCVNLYKPYDFKTQKAFDYKVIPQIIMDSNIYDYAKEKDILKKAKKIIKDSQNISKTTNVSISWHQRVCSSDYNWHKSYEELIGVI